MRVFLDSVSGVRRAVLFGVLALLSVVGYAQGDALQEANRLLKAGQHQQALDEVNKVIAAKPRDAQADAQARFLRGVILAEQGNAKEAIDVFQKLTQDYPRLPEPYNNLAVIYASQGQYDRARGALEQSIRTHPSYATAYENLGDVYAKLASQAYDKALQLDKSNTGAQNKLALVRELVGGQPMQVAAVTQKPAAEKPAAAAEKPAAKPAAGKPAATVAAAKPAAQTPAAKPAPAADRNAEVLGAVTAWAQAWSRKDADAYLAAYAKDFKTPGSESRAEWEKTRRARVTAPKSISVQVGSPKVSFASDTQASVSFRQDYRSDVFKGVSGKTLVMVKSDGRWLIQQEKTN